MEFLPKEPYKKVFYIVFYVILALFGAYFIFEYALAVILPFLISFFIACAVQKQAELLAHRTGGSKKIFSLVLGLSLLTGIAVLLVIFVSKLWQELYAFVSGVVGAREELLEKAEGLSQKIEAFVLRFFPDTQALRETLRGLLEKGVAGIISAVTTKLPAFMGKIFSEVPKMLFFVAALFISCIYFCLDFDKIGAFAKKHISRLTFAPLLRLPRTSFRTVAKYLRATFIIFLMTAAELAVGFLIIGAEYAWLLAVITAFIDVMPLFGSGAVLFPYALVSFVSGDFRKGMGLLILWGAVSLVRQITEPKIMGKNLGVHPLVNLAAVYTGYRFFGVTGVVFLPIAVVIVKNIFWGEKEGA